jgi:heterodisulfide reductase subunit C
MGKISIKETDAAFKYEVASHPGAENLKKCFSCGTCTAGCPVFRVEYGFNPRRIIRQILLGLRKDVLTSKMIWLCARCYACTANCPQEVNFADIITVLRDMAIREGYAPADMHEKVEQAGVACHELRRDCTFVPSGLDAAKGKDP